MHITVHYFCNHLDYFPSKLRDISEEQGEKYHQDISIKEGRYQERWYSTVFPNLFWLEPPFMTNKFLSPPTMPSTHINTIFSYCVFGMFEND